MEIRIAQPSDAEAIEAFDHVARSGASRREFINSSLLASGHCWVAVVDGQAVAYAVLEHTFFENGFVSMLYVNPEFRCRGLGSALLRHLEDQCRTAKLFTSTNQSNHAMRALLAKLNYKPSGVIENLDEGDPELVYFKRLGPVTV